MKKVIVSVILSTAILMGTAYASDAGSKDDPIVTRSYVDKRIEEKMEQQEDTIDFLLEQIQSLQDDKEPVTSSQGTYELVTIPQGGSLLGEQGTEMILRSGQASVVGSYNGGIQDVTDGVDLQHGQEAPKYHLMIIPRTEGRGIFAETEIIVMVRGGYTIQ